MRILFNPAHYVYDESSRGSELGVTFNIANRIANKYSRSIVITGKKNVKTNKKYKIIEVQKNKKKLSTSITDAALFNIRYTLAGIKVLKNNNFDIIHHLRPFLLGSTFNLIFLLGLNKKIPFIIGPFCSGYKVTDPSNYKAKNIIIESVYKLIERTIKPITYYLSVKTIKKADRIIVYDNFTKKQVERHTDERKIIIIPPGRDKKIYKFNKNKNFNGRIELIFVGYLIKRKGVDLLIKGFKKIVEKYPTTKLRIIGDGLERNNLKRMAKELSLDKKIIFQGFVENRYIQKFYKNAHIFVSMQREESFGQVYLESMACGLPIVTTETIGSKTIIKDNDFGFIIKQGDINEFCKKLIYLIENRQILKKMSYSARKHFVNNYDWDTVIIPKYLNLYKSY